jgi:YVTN family beta-propeller protein
MIRSNPRAGTARRKAGSLWRSLTSVLLALTATFSGTLAQANNVVGAWLSPSQDNWPLIPIHGAVMPDGRLLTYGTDGSGTQTGFFIYDVWDPSQGGLSNGHLTLDNMTLTDLFCSSQVILPQSGSVFLAGGDNWTGTNTTNTGNNNTNIFRYTDNTLSRANNMNRARWYSSSTVMPNGEVYIQGGSSGQDRPEVRTTSGTFRLLSNVDTTTLQALFPRNFVAHDGRIFGFDTNGVMYYVATSGTGQLFPAGQFSSSNAGWTSSAAMYRPGKILQMGGNSNGAIIIDITGSQPVVTTTQSMSTKRQWVSATILADGRVLATGGSTSDNQLTGVNTSAEVWNPATGTWTVGPNGSRARLYHSGAVLMPDASVLVMGGGAPGPLVNKHGEIYYPSYLYNASGGFASRPTISDGPDSIDIGQDFTINVGAADIRRVTLIKTGSVTHSVNMDQRFLELNFTSSSGTLFVDAPDSAAITTPGYYLLFAIDAQGVPSRAKIMRINVPANPTFPLDYTATPGGSGGSLYQVACNADEALVGAFGNSGTSINAVGVQCVRIDQFGRWIGNPVTRSQTGTATGTAFTRTCPQNSAVSAFKGRFSTSVNQLDFECKALTSDGRLTGTGQYLGPVGGTGGTAQGPFQCTSGNPAYAFSGKSGTLIDSFGLLCRQAPRTQVATNNAPVITNPGNQTSTVAIALTLTVTATDPDGNPVTFSASGLPAGLSIAGNGVISGTPTTAGTSNVSVTASDGSASSSANFTWTVVQQNPLVLDPMPNQPAQPVNTAVTYTATAHNGVNTRYRWYFDDGTETGWSSSPSVTHTFSAPTMYWVAVTATDDRGVEQTQTFSQIIHLPLTSQSPSSSSALAVTGGRVWVANPDNDSVSVFDASTNQKLAEIAVGTKPVTLAVAPSGGQVWVVNKSSATISVIDVATLTRAATIDLPAASRPYGIVFAPNASAAFVTLEGLGRLLRLDPVTGAVLGNVSVGSNPRHLSINSSSSRLYVARFITPRLPGEETANVQTSSSGGEVVVLDAGNLSILGTTTLRHSDEPDFENSGGGVPNYLGAPAISPDGTSAWVPSKQDNIKRGTLRSGANLNHQNTVRAIASRIDLATGLESYGSRIDLDNASLASAAAFDKFGVFMFVALETSREVAVVDAHNHAEFFRINVGRAPQSLAVSAGGYRLYVSNFMDRTVTVYDLTNLVDTGQWNIPLLATLNAVASEKLSPTVLKGKQFFYDARDARLAREGYMSCASCHNDGGGDGRIWDLTGLGEGLRSTIDLRGRAGMGHGPLHWTANFDEVQDFEGQIRALAGGTGLMSDTSFNQGTRSQPLGDPKAGVSSDLDALAAYVGSLNDFGKSPYRNSDGSLTSDAVAGKAIFEQQGCAQCHAGSAFTDSGSGGLHDVGTIKQPTSGKRLGGTLTGLDTPTLRGAWSGAPYLHDGSAGTLGQAVRAHAAVSIDDADLAKLVAYLQQIDSQEPAPAGAPEPIVLTGAKIGTTGGPGSYSVTGDVHTVTGAGGDIWGSSDRFYFAYQSMSGDGEVVARILSQQNTDPWAKAGVMIRETLASGARNAAMLLTPSNGETFQWRPVASKRSYNVGSGNGAVQPPLWLKLTRAGNTLTGFTSADGITWTQIGSATLNNLPTVVYVGLAVTSRVSGVGSTAVFDHLSVGTATPPPPDDTTPPSAPANLATTSVTETQVGLTWTAATDPAPGSGIARYEVRAGSNVIGNPTTTAFTATGLTAATTYDFTVIAIDAAGNRSAASSTLSVQTASPPPGDTTPPSVPAGLRATFVGQTQVTLAWDASTDPAPGGGVDEYEVAKDGVTLGSTATTGFTASGLTANTAYTFTVLAIDAAGNRSAASAPLAITTAAQAVDFTGANIGSTSAPGSYSSNGGTYSVSGAGADIWGSNDRFYFAYRTLSGDLSITARVVSQTNTDPWAKAGLMFREDLTTGSRNAAMLITPMNGEAFQYRKTAATKSYYIGSADPNRVAPIWLRLTRAGNLVTGYQSNDGVNWTLISSYTFTALPSSMLVGFAVTSRVSTTLSTVVYDSVVISGATTP